MAGLGIRKFTYDTVFTEDGRVLRAPEEQRVSFSPEELRQARAQAFEQGQRTALAEAEKAAARALEDIAAQVAALGGALDAVISGLRRDAVELGLASARAAAEAAMARCPEESVLALFSECLEDLRNAPVVAVSAPPGAAALVRERLAAHARQAGVRTPIEVREAPGPARIEWSAGAASVDPDGALARAREAAERWLSAAEQGADQLTLFGGR